MLALQKTKLTATEIPGLFHDSDGGYYIDSLEGAYWQQIWQSLPLQGRHTREMHLADLGRFPLPDEALFWLQETVTDPAGETMVLPEFLRRSQIPLFYGKNSVYIPLAALPVCRYFAQLWQQDNLAEEDLEAEKPGRPGLMGEVLSGFLVIHSFVGHSF